MGFLWGASFVCPREAAVLNSFTANAGDEVPFIGSVAYQTLLLISAISEYGDHKAITA
jgi:hypothetical protein